MNDMFYSAATGGFYASEADAPTDAKPITRISYLSLLEGARQGKVIIAGADGYPVLIDPPAPTTAETLVGYIVAIQKRLDDFAKTRNYDSILSAATYATSSVPKFAAEGQYAVEARDSTWTAAYAILADVESGQRAVPTLDEIVAELPPLAWPQ